MNDVLSPPGLAEQIAEVEREVRYREVYYEHRVATQKMSQRMADQKIATMRAVLETLRGLR